MGDRIGGSEWDRVWVRVRYRDGIGGKVGVRDRDGMRDGGWNQGSSKWYGLRTESGMEAESGLGTGVRSKW